MATTNEINAPGASSIIKNDPTYADVVPFSGFGIVNPSFGCCCSSIPPSYHNRFHKIFSCCLARLSGNQNKNIS